MQPRRKQDDWAQTEELSAAAPVERAAPVGDYIQHFADGRNASASPALALQEQLAARLAGAAPATAGVAGAIQPPEVKLPVALRLATIVMISVALWGGIYMAAINLITK